MTADTIEHLLARLAGVERELARRRAAAASTGAARATPWWDSPRTCVAMLARHEAAAGLVGDALARTPIARWDALVPTLDGHPQPLLRALRRRWLAEVAAAARGEEVTPTEVPSRDPKGPTEDEPTASPPAPETGDASPASGAAARPRRDTSPERNAPRLARWLDRAFGAAVTREPGDDAAPAVEDGRAWFEVAPRGDGALAVFSVLEPIDGFASFVKALAATSGAWRHGLRRENLARLGARIEVPPACSKLTWTTGDPDDDVAYAALLTAMTPAPLADNAPTAFRTDVAGRAQRMAGTSVAAGARYAVLLPPSLTAPEGALVEVLGEGWRLWSLALPAVPDDALAAALGALGLSVGSAALDAAWIAVPPRRWEATARGDRLPVFAPGDVAFVRVTSGVARGDMVAFLWGNDALQRLPLATTERVDVALERLPAGRYVFEVTCADRAVAPARLAFVVDANLRGAWPVDAPAVTLGTRRLAPGDACEDDLSSLGESLAWSITASPGMPVRVRWESHDAWDSGWMAADAEGVVDLTAAMVRTRTMREAAVVGALSIDFGEWGVVRVDHARTAALACATARRTLRDAMDAAATLHGAGLADPLLAASLWGAPVAAALGYRVGELPDAARGLSAGLAVLLVESVEPANRGFRARPAALLALLPPSQGVRAREPGTPRAALDAVGAAVGLTRAIVSDGRRWWALDLARSAPPMPDSLDAVIDDDEGLEGFLVRYGAWR